MQLRGQNSCQMVTFQPGFLTLTQYKNIVKESCQISHSEIYKFLDKAKIPTRSKQKVAAKMRKKYRQFKNLKKKKNQGDIKLKY